ncbi:MAG: FAD-dependent monooxygenase [Geminicoccaceae bacterium]
MLASREHPVLVVGAGPTGLVVAIELLRRGVPVRLVERHPELPDWSAAIFIKQRTLEILASIGLISHFVEQGEWVRGVKFYSDGEEVAAYDFGAIDSPYQNILSIPESASIRILADEVRRLGGEIELGTEFVALEQDGESVTVRLRSAERGEWSVETPWIVGTDGFHSAVREAIGDRYEGKDYGELWAVFDTGLESWEWSRDSVRAQLDPPLLLQFPLAPDRWRMYCRVATAGDDLAGQVTQKLRSLCPEATLDGAPAPAYFHSHSRLAQTFRIGRVFLAGDAAHASNPVQGHGMNAGIQDAFNLGWKLAAATSGRGTEELLRSYDAERRSIDREVVASGDEAYGWMTDRTGEKLREVYAFLKEPTGQALAAMGETELACRYPDSAIIEDCRDGATGPVEVGARIPDVPDLAGPEGETSLHALLALRGPTILLLTADAAPDAGPMARGLAPVLERHADARLVTVVRGGSAVPSAEGPGPRGGGPRRSHCTKSSVPIRRRSSWSVPTSMSACAAVCHGKRTSSGIWAGCSARVHDPGAGSNRAS